MRIIKLSNMITEMRNSRDAEDSVGESEDKSLDSATLSNGEETG